MNKFPSTMGRDHIIKWMKAINEILIIISYKSHENNKNDKGDDELERENNKDKDNDHKNDDNRKDCNFHNNNDKNNTATITITNRMPAIIIEYNNK